MAKKVQKHTKRKKITQSKKGKRAGRPTVRSASSYPALQQRFYSKIKQEYFDIDYLDKLDKKTLKVLNEFMEETLNARFNHPGTKRLKTKAQKKVSMDANNARNRDLYSIIRATGMFSDVPVEKALEDFQIEQYDNCLIVPDPYENSDETIEILTEAEYDKLIASGVNFTKDVKDFYENLFNKKLKNTSE
jgi:hypothetical protein